MTIITFAKLVIVTIAAIVAAKVAAATPYSVAIVNVMSIEISPASRTSRNFISIQATGIGVVGVSLSGLKFIWLFVTKRSIIKINPRIVVVSAGLTV
jgi:hypothetical protein